MCVRISTIDEVRIWVCNPLGEGFLHIMISELNLERNVKAK
jgi:hypothetical protein